MSYLIFSLIVIAIMAATVWALRKWYPNNNTAFEAVALGVELIGAILSALT